MPPHAATCKKNLEASNHKHRAGRISSPRACKHRPRRVFPHECYPTSSRGPVTSSVWISPFCKMTMDVAKKEDEYTIKPQAVTPALDTSSWPLLLKNYDKREWRIASFPLD